MFKLALPALVNALGMKICIAHSPPYTAKANPLEPRLPSRLNNVSKSPFGACPSGQSMAGKSNDAYRSQEHYDKAR
ncbi:MAG: hypothetical protein KME45_07340 [Stenomitos rutilans HA7619-LM2]|jgi:hypothetical protein|nr:hypothetical protein [Stenomitos rutilans HA7619-LM2]